MFERVQITNNLNFTKMKTKISMYQILGGSKIYNFELVAISEEHAHIVVRDFYERMGFFSRFYYETSNGGCYSIKA